MQTRGIRNNNPGNIERTSTRWQGMADDQSADERFIVFRSARWGIRAIARILITYQDQHGLNTVAGIINRWAPPVENNTAAYSGFVAKQLGVGTDEQIDVYDYKVMREIVEAIITMENGKQPYDEECIQAGLVLAGIEPPAKEVLKTTTGQAATAAGAATVAGAALPVLESARGTLTELSTTMEVARWALLAVTLAAIGIVIWQKIDSAGGD